MPLDPDRRALLNRIIAEGTRRRQAWMAGSGTVLVLVIGLLAVTLTHIGGGADTQNVVADGGGRTPSVPPATSTTLSPTTTPDTVADDGSTSTTAGPGPTPSTTVPLGPGGTWSALPPAGVAPRFGGATAWTGTELLVWGGRTSVSDAICIPGPNCPDPEAGDGVAFNPTTNTWRKIAPSPVAAGASAWTGSELVVWGSVSHPGVAAYNPVSDTWRTLPAGPLPGGYGSATTLGSEVYFFRAGPPAPGTPQAAALDPATGKWRVLPNPPASDNIIDSAPAGGQVVLLMANWNQAQGAPQLVAMSPAGVWRTLAELPANSHAPSIAVASGRVWTVSCRGPDSEVEATFYGVDVSTGAVITRSGAAAGGGCPTLVAAGDRILSLTPIPDEYKPERIEVQQMTADGWQELTPPPAARVGAATWTGSEVLFWGTCACGGMGGTAIEAGFRLRL